MAGLAFRANPAVCSYDTEWSEIYATYTIAYNR